MATLTQACAIETTTGRGVLPYPLGVGSGQQAKNSKQRSTRGPVAIDWVVLTMATRPDEFECALDSIYAQSLSGTARPIVVANGVDVSEVVRRRPGLELLTLPSNVGIPAGRDIGIRAAGTRVVGLLDDDAVLEPDVSAKVLAAFDADPWLGAVALRIIDEEGETSRRHVPRPGGDGAELSGPVTFFLGGAHAVRADAYREVGGYFGDLLYGHEEIELSWRLIDAGWSIEYLADAVAFHPRTIISRRSDGWILTGRNRVWIARRTLPWSVAIAHTATWLVLGTWRAPSECKRSYLRGWLSGWKGSIHRRPIRWRTVWRLTRLGRPPVI